MPFGDVGKGEFGTYFIGYARSPARIEHMLTNMFVGRPPGNYDRLLDFSRAVTGTLFFVPVGDFPRRCRGPNADPQRVPPIPTNARTSPEPRSDGSLGIGSLKEGSRT